MSDNDKVPLSQALWGRIHARAWIDDEFRQLLETDPGAAVRQFAEAQGLPVPDKVMYVSPRPQDLDNDTLTGIVNGDTPYNHAVPACC